MKGRSIVDRLGALSGAAFVLLVFIGNGLSTDLGSGGEASNSRGEQVMADLGNAAASTTVAVGYTMELAGFVMFLVFVAYLYAALRRGEGSAGWLAVVVLTGGLTEVAIKLGSGAVIGAEFLGRDTLTPEVARALDDIGGAAFVLSWLPFGVLVAGAGAAVLGSRVIGRGFGWAGLVVGTACTLSVLVAGITHLDRANPIPFLLSALWLGVVSVRLGVREPLATPVRIPESAPLVNTAA
jgi:hypothetical protein